MLRTWPGPAALVLGLALGLPGAAPAAPVAVTWQEAEFTGIAGVADQNNFDVGQVSFPGFTANSLSGIAGTGIYHNHSGVRTFSIAVELDGVFTDIFSDTLGPASVNRELALIRAPLFFALGTVTGIRLSVAPEVLQGWHLLSGGMGEGTTFSFDTLVPVPLPAAGWLLLGGLAVLAAARRRASAQGRADRLPPG